MKKIALVALAVSLAVTPVYAAGPTQSVPMTCVVPGVLELNATIFEGNIGGPVKTEADFGTLVVNSTSGTMSAAKQFTIGMLPNTSGQKYQITSSAPAMSKPNGAVLPFEACIVEPTMNGKAVPPLASLGPRESFVNPGKVIYMSGPSGEPVLVGAKLTLGSGLMGPESIPSTQQAGAYRTTITFTLTLI